MNNQEYCFDFVCNIETLEQLYLALAQFFYVFGLILLIVTIKLRYDLWRMKKNEASKI